MTRITATQASRSFSALLNRVQAGEEIEIVRNGAPVAVIGPPPTRKMGVTAAELQAVVDMLPPLDDDFIKDLEDIRRESGPPRVFD